jgi:hypothetical protein
MTPSPEDLWNHLEAMRTRPIPPRPAHLRMTPAQLRARLDAMPQDKQDQLYAEAETIYRQLMRSRRWYRRDPEDLAATFTFGLGLGAIAISPFVGSDVTYLTGGALLVITLISWAIARHFRYHR